MEKKYFAVGLLVIGLIGSAALAAEPALPDVANMSPEAQKECLRKNREGLAGDPYRPLY